MHAERDYPPPHRPSTSTGPLAANSHLWPHAPITTINPCSDFLCSIGSALILGSDTAQEIFQDQRSISDMGFRLPGTLNDGISLLHHQIQVLGSFALMPENRLHFILLLTIDHYGKRWSFLPFELLGLLEPFQVQHMEDRMDPLGWGQIQFARTPLEKSPWRLGKVQSQHLRNLEGRCWFMLMWRVERTPSSPTSNFSSCLEQSTCDLARL